MAQATAPSVPQNVQVTPGDASCTLTWAAPASWGTWPAIAYTIDVKGGAAGFAEILAQPTADVTSYVISGRIPGTSETISNGTEYSIRISASSQNPATDGSHASHFRTSAHVTKSCTPALPEVQFESATYTFTEGQSRDNTVASSAPG